MATSQRSGFSLSELLVVLAIIAALAVILFPVFTRAREASRGAPCTAHLHQVALALTAYLEDNDQALPPCGLAEIRSPADRDRLWFWQIAPYFNSLGVLHCPADNVRNAQRALSATAPWAWNRPDLPALSYGANWDLMNAATRGVRQAKAAALPYPSLTLLVADCTEPWAFGPVYTDAAGVRWSHIAYANGPPVAQGDPYLHGGRSGVGQERHGRGSFIAFMDGHVGFLPAARFYRGTRFVVTDRSGEGSAELVERPLLSPDAVPPDGD